MLFRIKELFIWKKLIGNALGRKKWEHYTGTSAFVFYMTLLILTGCGTLCLHNNPAQSDNSVAYFYAHPGTVFDPIKLTRMDDCELNARWIKWLEILPGQHTVYFICKDDKTTGDIERTDEKFYLKNHSLYFNTKAGHRYGIEIKFYSNAPCYRIIEIGE